MRSLRVGLLALVCAAALAIPSVAGAHARPPRFSQIAFDPSDPDTIVLTATFGLVASDDGGASWRWTCAAVYGTDPTREDPRVALASGATLIGSFAGLARTEDRCDFAFPEGPVADAFVTDVAIDPADPRIVWGLVSSGLGPDRVVRSDDAGESWRTVGEGIDAVLLERIARAPSDPSRLYVSGWRPASGTAPRRAFVYASRDSGARLDAVEIDLLEGERIARIGAVDPADAERLFVYVTRGELDERPERLLVSTDGGRTFDTALELPRIAAVAIEGSSVWVGSSGGLWVARDGSLDFEQLSALDVTCLSARDGDLWVCADPRTSPFALGRSSDGGETIEPVVRMEEVTELAACPRCSTAGVQCPAWAPDLLTDYAIWLGGEDAAVSPTGLPRDAGVPPECAPPAPSCACRASPAGPSPLVPWVAIGAVVLSAGRRGRAGAGRRDGEALASRRRRSRPDARGGRRPSSPRPRPRSP